MKPDINGFPRHTPWYKTVICESSVPMVRINNINQYHPLHYHDKHWATDELIKEYENELGRRS